VAGARLCRARRMHECDARDTSDNCEVGTCRAHERGAVGWTCRRALGRQRLRSGRPAWLRAQCSTLTGCRQRPCGWTSLGHRVPFAVRKGWAEGEGLVTPERLGLDRAVECRRASAHGAARQVWGGMVCAWRRSPAQGTTWMGSGRRAKSQARATDSARESRGLPDDSWPN
jgi:hypothetical protein